MMNKSHFIGNLLNDMSGYHSVWSDYGITHKIILNTLRFSCVFQAAAALLFSQMVTCGVNAEVQPFDMLQACLAVFTDLDQV